MNQSYKLLKHKIFSQHLSEFINSFSEGIKPSIIEPLKKALEKIKEEPFSFSHKPLREIKDKKLQGIIRRVYIGGSKKYRLVYLCPPGTNFIIPFYISKVLRKDFNYDDHIKEIELIAIQISKDLKQGNHDAFENW